MSKGKYFGGDPDKGPQIKEGAHKFDKGYVSDSDYFSLPGVYPDDHQRGNHYMENQNEAVRRDSKRLYRSQFSKIA